MKYLYLLLPLFYSAGAEAGPLCKNLREMQNTVQSCEDNGAYALEAVRCVERLKSVVTQAQKKIAANLGLDAGKSQSQSQSLSAGAYDSLLKTLDPLVALAESSQKEVTAYAENMYLPEDADNPDIVGGNMKEFLKDSECYQDNKEVLDTVLSDMREVQEDLMLVRGAAASGQWVALDQEKKLGGGAGAPAPQPSGTANRNTKQAPTPGASGVSGTEVLKKKAK